MGPVRGLIWSFLLGYLFLPEAFGFDLPFLPPYNKSTAIAAACLIGHFFSGHPPGSPLGLQEKIHTNPKVKLLFSIFIGLALFAPIITVLTNPNALRYGRLVLPGLGIRDYISMVVEQGLLLIPFFVAQYYLFDRSSHRQLLRALVLCGLGYSLLILFEYRMSPQLHQWTYGFFQHGWHQHIRDGGFRPIVFLSHGLQVGFFLFATTIAAIALSRGKNQNSIPWLICAGWLSLVLLLSRNLGAVAIAIPLVPIALLLARRVQMKVAIGAVLLLLLVPMLRQTDSLPLDRIVEMADSISSERAASLSYRLRHEDAILDRASEKPFAGWGVWARWRIYSSTGEDLSTVDGLWINIFAERGWLGYFGFFVFLTVPFFLLARLHKQKGIGHETMGLVLILAGYFVYVIPNSAGGVFIWLLAGAIAGIVQREAVAPQDTADQSQQSSPLPQSTRYSRFPNKTNAS